MLTPVEVALYFLGKDSSRSLFTKNLIQENGRKFYDGNARLNKYLHLAQNIYIARFGKPLISDVFYAYDNGAVSIPVQESFSHLVDCNRQPTDTITPEEKDFLDRFFVAFKSASLAELIDLSHEDPEWKKRSSYYSKEDQKMDTIGNIDVYQRQYRDIATVLYRMN